MPGILSRLVVALAIGSVTSVLAHSWIDCVKFDPASGECLGYSRGYKGREKVEPNGRYTYRFGMADDSKAMCKPESQSKMDYDKTWPMATAQPGETIYTVWQMNGHLNDNNPTKLNILYYPDSDKEFKESKERKTAKKAATLNFATSKNCYVPSEDNTNCLGPWKIPEDLTPGKTYHFVWYWYFNDNNNPDPSIVEYYSTCFDIKIESSSYVSPIKSLSEAISKGPSEPMNGFMNGVTSNGKSLLAKTKSIKPESAEADENSPIVEKEGDAPSKKCNGEKKRRRRRRRRRRNLATRITV
ncbi:hypothetical protein H4S08_004195 [Coemansia sp. RSA 1365]|nr:hypothetical protein H4S08_004195 [Coemansia sp. RSA 1365]